MNNNIQIYKKVEGYGTVYIISPNPEKGFYFGYSLFVPDGCLTDNSLLVHATNTGGYGVTNGKLDHNKQAIHIGEGIEAAKIHSISDIHINISKELNMPVLTPLIPRIKGLYTHFYGSKICNNNFEDLINSNSERNTSEKLSDDEINEIKNTCCNLDLQVVKMIESAKEVLENMKIYVDKKVIIEGYLAGSKFANGFTALHPNLVKACICGGNSGISVLPTDQINYPFGFNNIENANVNEYSSIPKLFYIGQDDYNDPAQVKDLNAIIKKAVFDCYTEEEIKYIYDNLGSDVQTRFTKLSELFQGTNTTFKRFKGNHGTVFEDPSTYKSIIEFISKILKDEYSHDVDNKHL